jgi:hypothetical protein
VFSTPVKKGWPVPLFPPKGPSAALFNLKKNYFLENEPQVVYPPLNASKWLQMP